eukprot:23680-Pelagococcus_subviridis.AAC.2
MATRRWRWRRRTAARILRTTTERRSASSTTTTTTVEREMESERAAPSHARRDHGRNTTYEHDTNERTSEPRARGGSRRRNLRGATSPSRRARRCQTELSVVQQQGLGFRV